jgi:uncharacterized phage protein (TIGR02220 family)
MELILFLKDLQKKGKLYYEIWMPLLIQYNDTDLQTIKLSITPNVPKGTYHRVIAYGIESFSKYVTTITIVKKRNELVIERVLIKAPKKVVSEVVVEVAKIEPIKKAQRQPRVEPKTNENLIEPIIEYLNECTGKSYKTNSKIAISNINARLKEGYTLDDFKKVIFVKSTKWIGSKMEDYLTPNTLFGTKFESYLNENINTPKTSQESAYEQVIKATELGFNN